MLFEAFLFRQDDRQAFCAGRLSTDRRTIVREAKSTIPLIHFLEKKSVWISFETEEALRRDRGGGSVRICGSGRHSEIVREKGEPPFLFLLDNIEDPQ